MCANYTPPPPRALRERFELRIAEPDFGYAAEAYPASVAPCIWLDEPGPAVVVDGRGSAAGDAANGPVHEPGLLRPRPAHFGLLPAWARDDKLMRQTYNARSETVAGKPSFRKAWRQRQFCLVPMEAFYEPCYEDGKPVRWRIERADGEPFLVAGLWEQAWRDAPTPRSAMPMAPATEPAARVPVWSFTLLTVNADAHPLMGRFHAPGDEKRSIVALDAPGARAWLDAGRHGDEAAARALLRPVSAEAFVARAFPRPAAARKTTAGRPSTERAGRAARRESDEAVAPRDRPMSGELFADPSGGGEPA